MVPCVGVAIRGQKFYPLMNNEAMFRMQDEFPPDVLDQISDDGTKAGFKLAFDVFRMLCEEGEAVRRFYGYEPGPLPEWEEAKLTYLPNDVVAVRTAVYQAITAGGYDRIVCGIAVLCRRAKAPPWRAAFCPPCLTLCPGRISPPAWRQGIQEIIKSAV